MICLKNPTWTRDELILLLDVYYHVDMKRVSRVTAEVIDLSALLNDLPIHSTSLRTPEFRNPSGVHMKLRNLCRFDPQFHGRGLGRGGRLEQIVWNDFSANIELLHDTAQAIRSNLKNLPEAIAASLGDVGAESDEFREGRLLTRLHKWRERNPTLVRKKKQERLSKTGKLACEVCGFDFAERYGELGAGYVECHHLIPLSAINVPRKTRLSDLAIV